jgi:hypothetical protein
MNQRIALPLILLCACLLSAKESNVPTDAELAAITARGRLLAEYDQAAWHATDAVAALKPDTAAAPFYIARKLDKKWEVVFGRLNAARDRFLIVYRATQGAGPEDFAVKKEEPPAEDRGYYLAAAKAIELAVKDFGPQNRNYNTYLLPSSDGRLYVYLLPAPTQAEPHPLGIDVRYTITLDGGTIVDKRIMHQTLLENTLSAPPGAKVVSGHHTHALSDAPEESDVFVVLTRKPSMPEYIGTPDKHTYAIETDGKIKRVK